MDLKSEVEKLKGNLLPEKSKKRYLKVRHDFENWMRLSELTEINEDAVLVYLSKKSDSLAPSGLYSIFSMLKATLPNYGMEKYYQVKAYLKKNAKGHKPKKASTFTTEDFHTFISSADHITHLLHIVIVILGIAGAMRRKEIYDLEEEDVKDKRDFIEVRVKNTKNDLDRKFMIVNKKDIKFADIIRSYKSLRPKECKEKRFLFAYNKGKASNLPVGINKVGEVPLVIAKFLNLPDAETTLLAESGAYTTN